MTRRQPKRWHRAPYRAVSWTRVEFPGQRRVSVIFWISLGVCLVALASVLNIGWLVANWPSGILAILGGLAGLTLIAGLVLNTVFLVREIRRNEKHDAFINAVTHELKTPVASVKLYLQTLQSRRLDESRQREFYQTMLADMNRLQATIEQVLLAGSMGSPRKPQRSRVDVNAVVRDCMGKLRLSYNLPAGTLSFGSDLPGDEPPMVLGNRDELSAAVSNLIDNAIKYSKERTRVRIEIAKPEPALVSIRVRDSGIGIDNDELKRVFRRFYRVPSAFRAKGTGLGLYIVRSVAKKHGGRVMGESPGPGQGSTFTLELPLAAQT